MITLTLPRDADVGAALVRGLCDHLNARLPLAAPAAEEGFRALISSAVQASPEYASLLGGRLRAELGVADPLRALVGVVEALKAAVKAEVIPCRPAGPEQITGGMTVTLYRPDLSSSLGDLGRFRSEGGYSIDWLDWLLNSGDRVLVSDHRFEPGRGGRTRMGVMTRGGRWGVPAEFAGTPSDNWLTRAVLRAEPLAQAVFESALKKVL